MLICVNDELSLFVFLSRFLFPFVVVSLIPGLGMRKLRVGFFGGPHLLCLFGFCSLCYSSFDLCLKLFYYCLLMLFIRGYRSDSALPYCML